MDGFSIITDFIAFVKELISSFGQGYLFFGSPFDIIRYAIDIILVAAMFYSVMLFIRQTRAWQLIKGIVLILLIVLICGFMGLDMVNYIFNRFLYVFAFLIIVIFQPEFRRALETVGIRSIGSLREIIKPTDKDDHVAELSTFIHEICVACSELAKTYTGALILIERTTRLEELLAQENVVRLNSSVTNSMIQSIFYKGAPMHDGGLLIRDGVIIAARCHVPLSVTMHSLQRTGTRHRAAVGASEMGDTIAVVVSEERGAIAIAVNGNLYEMKDRTELEANLSYLLGLDKSAPAKSKFSGVFKSKNKKNQKRRKVVAENKTVTKVQADGNAAEGYKIKSKIAEDINSRNKVNLGNKIFMLVLSFILSMGLWVYIQITNNPVVEKNFTVDLVYSEDQKPKDVQVLNYPINSVEITVVGRENTISKLTNKDIVASIDFSSLKSGDEGVKELPLVIKPLNSRIYFRVKQKLPETISITVYSES
ncbi:MAG: diadenylate cyclase [Clostridiales bacterium]|nr:diadenylate cyclase [Clostridiales bacterium]